MWLFIHYNCFENETSILLELWMTYKNYKSKKLSVIDNNLSYFSYFIMRRITSSKYGRIGYTDILDINYNKYRKVFEATSSSIGNRHYSIVMAYKYLCFSRDPMLDKNVPYILNNLFIFNGN